MRKAVGFLIILFGLSHYFNQSFSSLDDAASQVFSFVETSASVAEEGLLTEE